MPKLGGEKYDHIQEISSTEQKLDAIDLEISFISDSNEKDLKKIKDDINELNGILKDFSKDDQKTFKDQIALLRDEFDDIKKDGFLNEEKYQHYYTEYLTNFEEHKDDPHAKEILLKAIKRNPERAFQFLDKYKDEPYAEEILLIAIAREPFMNTVGFFDLYKDQPYAENVFLKSMEGNVFTNAFESFDLYKDQPYAENILFKSVEYTPGAVFQYFNTYKDQSCAENVLLKAVENDPGAAFAYFSYKDEPYAERILLKATELHPEYAFQFLGNYKGESYAENVLLKATENAPRKAFEYFEDYKDEPYADVVLTKAKEKDLLLKATENDPRKAFEYFEDYKDEPYADIILTKAKEKDLLLKAAENDPRNAFQFIGKYKDESYAEEVLLKAVERQPENAFQFLDKYKDEPYAESILSKSMINENITLDIPAYLKVVRTTDFGDMYTTNRFQKFVSETPGINNLSDFLKDNELLLKVGNREIDVKNNFNFLRGLLEFMRTEDITTPQGSDVDSRKTIIAQYQESLNEFIQQPDFDKIFFIEAQKDKGEDWNGAFASNTIRSTFIDRYGEKVSDYSSDTELHSKEINSPDDFVQKVKEYNKQYPNEKVLVYIGLHGGEDGSAEFSKGNFQKEHFEELANISPNIVLNISSCNSAYKFDENVNTSGVMLASEKHVGTTEYSRLFKEAMTKKNETDDIYVADYDGDGKVCYNEAMLYVMEHYTDAFMPTSFINNTGKLKTIANIDEKKEETVG